MSAALANRLAGNVTTLATCWRITCMDGTAFFVTDHDRDLPFEGDVYMAGSGYGVAVVAQIAVFPPFGIQVTLVDRLMIGALFTIASLAPSYQPRRVFEVRSAVSWATPR
jgi:hypothetical protein